MTIFFIILILLLMSILIFFGSYNKDLRVKQNIHYKIDNTDNVEIESVEKGRDPIQENQVERDSLIKEKGIAINTRFATPIGFERVPVEENSFADYLRSLPLKPDDAEVLYYDGRTKTNQGIYEAVIDMDIGIRNLQQCADAIMRLRGEYLYHKEEYNRIHFNLTNGFEVGYTKWSEGYRVAVEGNNTYWVKKTEKSNTYSEFRKYMNFIFIYAGTISLAQELEAVSIEEMMIGDILIQGGSPGHAVIVVDMAENNKSGEKLYMLAQSYMPAQDIQILKNPNNELISPWYELNQEEVIKTPEWTFSKDDLKRFDE
ncbi:MAG: DUF4846 domain-containing protein [Halanaerobiales bacterium]